MEVRLRAKGSKGPGSYKYKHNVIAQDPKQVAQIFYDLYINGVLINKALIEFEKILKKTSQGKFPW